MPKNFNIELAIQELKENGSSFFVETQKNNNGKIDPPKTELSILNFYCNLLKIKFEKEIEFLKKKDKNEDGVDGDEDEYISIYVDGEYSGISFYDEGFDDSFIKKYINIIIGLLGNNYESKETAKEIDSWSYIDEENESKNITEQIKYNQTLAKIIRKYSKVIANSKLKPLFETIKCYEETEAGGKIESCNIEYVIGDKDENLLFLFESSYKQTYKLFSKYDFEMFISIFGENPSFNTKIHKMTIKNIDDGVFGIENDKKRIENRNQIVLYTNPHAELDYLAFIIELNKKFSGVEHIDYRKAKEKYSYHGPMAMLAFKEDE